MPSTSLRQNIIARAHRIVVKIGTNGICDDRGKLDHSVVAGLADQVAAIMRNGACVTLVASGAVGAGQSELKLMSRPKMMPQLQATAAVGQGRLMDAFHDAFARHDLQVAQLLLTRDVFENRTRYLNVRNTLNALADFHAVPIINENDAVAIDELKFGDNDVIAALVANMLDAELLVLLSSIEGVLKDGKVLDLIEKLDDQTLSLATGQKSKLGSGGMGSKMSAAGLVTKAGQVAVIANARAPQVLTRLLAGERVGTVFKPSKSRMSSRRRWIGQASRPAGKIIIDEGAVKALTGNGKSLLPSGITAVSGRFARGATISILDITGKEIARGLSNYSADQLDKIKGLRTSQIQKILGEKAYDEAVHRNNLSLR